MLLPLLLNLGMFGTDGPPRTTGPFRIDAAAGFNAGAAAAQHFTAGPEVSQAFTAGAAAAQVTIP